jgi:D-3-phosphoglycerate dehydrogenase
LVFDPFFEGDPQPAEVVDLSVLLQQSDIVSLHARLTPDSQHLIGVRELAQMKRSAVLINTARSGLIDEPALVNALSNQSIAGAGLDVFDVEPLPNDHPLLRLDNVTITPHLAGSTIDAFRNSPKLMANHLVRLLRRQEPLPIVNGIRPELQTV